MVSHVTAAELVFLITLVATFGAALLARRHSPKDLDYGLAEMKLNRWLVGLSAGTTANSGFIVTAAVGLGYVYGLQWILLPLSWMLGDLLFWYVFPARVNAYGRESRATTLSELLIHKLAGPGAPAVAILTAAVILVCLSGYTSAQWLAGQKFLAGAFAMPDWAALGLFALLIIAYSSIGGFRGSVYTDAVQAVIRIAGTIVALGAVIWFAAADGTSFWQNMTSAGDGFLSPFPGGFFVTAGFIAGFAAAAIGFGLGQPQIVSRYLAGSSPEETRSAWWIYVSFVQFTWIAMTFFGLVLRGVMPGIADPETGLSVFFQKNIGALLTGLIVADVFATIAATSNGLLIAMSQVLTHDLLPRLSRGRGIHVPLSVTTLGVGAITMLVSVCVYGSVVSVALSSVSLMGAGLAAVVMIKIMRWQHSGPSLLAAIICGLIAAATWKYLGFSTSLNEAGIGIVAGLATNWLAVKARTWKPLSLAVRR